VSQNPVRPGPPGRERRSQAERTAETRARLIAAVIESIDEVGFTRTTAQEIARRAGVTWGAVQHHFGGKDGILIAVLEHSFDAFMDRLGALPVEDDPLPERVSLFIDRAWEHFGSPLYRTTFEIMREYSTGEGGSGGGWQDQMFRAWNELWDRIFQARPRSRRRRFALQHYTIAVLSGLAGTLMLEGAGATLHAAELDLLKETLVRELGPD
jgi:AcrR family transcriptional regulator